MLEDLRNQKACFFGIQGSGKTYAVKQLIGAFKRPLVYRVTADFDDTKGIYLVKPEKSVVKEFKQFIQYAKKLAEQKKIDLVVIDEADMFLLLVLLRYP